MRALVDHDWRLFALQTSVVPLHRVRDQSLIIRAYPTSVRFQQLRHVYFFTLDTSQKKDIHSAGKKSTVIKREKEKWITSCLISRAEMPVVCPRARRNVLKIKAEIRNSITCYPYKCWGTKNMRIQGISPMRKESPQWSGLAQDHGRYDASLRKPTKAFKVTPPLAVYENEYFAKFNNFCCGRVPVLVNSSLYRALKLTCPWEMIAPSKLTWA